MSPEKNVSPIHRTHLFKHTHTHTHVIRSHKLNMTNIIIYKTHTQTHILKGMRRESNFTSAVLLLPCYFLLASLAEDPASNERWKN